ncbi:MAG: hypothetical protein ACKPKO_62960, partial [Candidatus Fonsibacter sp.]
TRRLSQAALYMELFGEEDIEFYKNPGYTPDEDEEYKFWVFFFLIDYFEKARVTVTEKNQKWLSPVPIWQDIVEVKIRSGDYRVKYFDFFVANDLKNNKHTLHRIVERIYPNNKCAPLIQWDDPNNKCAPLIQWDEVILPEEKTNDQ